MNIDMQRAGFDSLIEVMGGHFCERDRLCPGRAPATSISRNAMASADMQAAVTISPRNPEGSGKRSMLRVDERRATARKVPKGYAVQQESVIAKRSGTGIFFGKIGKVPGRLARSDVAGDTAIKLEDFE